MTDFLPTIVDRGFHFLHVLLRLMYILRSLCAYLKKVKTKFANIKTETVNQKLPTRRFCFSSMSLANYEKGQWTYPKDEEFEDC